MEIEKSTTASITARELATAHINDVAQHIGNFVQYWGFKKIHGRIWTHLFLSSAPIDAGTLVRRLGVSKALISMSLKELIKHRVIHQAGRSSENTQLYDINPDITGVILNVLRSRELLLIEKIQHSTQDLTIASCHEGESRAVSPERVNTLKQLIEAGRSTLEGLLVLKDEPVNWNSVQTETC